MYKEIVNKHKWRLYDTMQETLEDQLSANKIVLSVTQETKKFYHEIFNKSNYCGTDIEPYFREDLKKLLDDLIDKTTKDLGSLCKKLN